MAKIKKMKNDPCWKGYEMIGKKKKNGKEVPNCVPMKEMTSFKTFVEEFIEVDPNLIQEEAEYQGKKVTLNKPFRLPGGSNKKFGVYTHNGKGNVVKVTFGDPNMEIKRDDPERRKSYRARHHCDINPGPKWKANYWSCMQWRAGHKVEESATINNYIEEKLGDKTGVSHITKQMATDVISKDKTEGPKIIAKSVTWGDGASKQLENIVIKALDKIKNKEKN